MRVTFAVGSLRREPVTSICGTDLEGGTMRFLSRLMTLTVLSLLGLATNEARADGGEPTNKVPATSGAVKVESLDAQANPAQTLYQVALRAEPDDDDKPKAKKKHEEEDEDDDKPKAKTKKKHEEEDEDDDKPKAKKKHKEEDDDDKPKAKTKKKHKEEVEDDDKPKAKTKKKHEEEVEDDDKPKAKTKKKHEEEDEDDDKPKAKTKKKHEEEDEDDDKPKGKAKKKEREEDEDEDKPKAKKKEGKEEDEDDDKPKTKKKDEDKDDESKAARSAVIDAKIDLTSRSASLSRADEKGDSSTQENREWTKSFQVKERDLATTGRNPYFILEPGYQLVLKGNEKGKEIELVVTVLNDTREVDGVETRVVEERESEDGQPVEISRNFFAISRRTNDIYYFGEEVDIYKNGRVVDHEGAWLSGVKGAKFGLAMPGTPLIGARHYQEVAPGVALDRAEILGSSGVLETAAGTFKNCLKVEETTPLEPDAKEVKLYALGVGLIKDGPCKLVRFGISRK
jgi:hypothetical protein